MITIIGVNTSSNISYNWNSIKNKCKVWQIIRCETNKIYFTNGSDGSLYLRLTTPTSSRPRKVTSFVKWNFHFYHTWLQRLNQEFQIDLKWLSSKQWLHYFRKFASFLDLSYSFPFGSSGASNDKQLRHLLGWIQWALLYTSMELQSFAIAKIFYKIWIQMRLLPSVKFYLTKTLDLTFF